MHRTQIYLSDAQLLYLHNLSRKRQKKLSELIREAIDQYYVIEKQQDVSHAIDAVFGLWSNRRDLPDTGTYLRELRKSVRLKRMKR